MTEGVNNQETAAPEQQQTTSQSVISDRARDNFRRLEEAREAEKEARIRAEAKAEMMEREISNIKSMLTPQEKDPLDDVEDYVDKDRLRAKLAREREAYKKEAEQIAKRSIEEYEAKKQQAERKNYKERLKNNFRDYDDVMTEQSLNQLAQTDPLFVKAISHIQDDYERGETVYEYLKSRKPQEKPSIKEKVEANMHNPYYVPASSGTPSAIDFDVKSKSARDAAYAKLKSAIKKGVSSDMNRPTY